MYRIKIDELVNGEKRYTPQISRSRIMTGRMVRVDIVWDNLSNKQYLKETKALKVIWKHKKHMDNLKEYKVKTTTYKNIE